jgi:hypothetical protein
LKKRRYFWKAGGNPAPTDQSKCSEMTPKENIDNSQKPNNQSFYFLFLAFIFEIFWIHEEGA